MRRLVDGHEHYAAASSYVLHLLHNTASARRIKTGGGFIKEGTEEMAYE